MTSFAHYSLAELGRLRDELHALATPCKTLREAAEACTSRLYEEFSESLVLARCFTTLPFGFLPEAEKTFARAVAAGRGASGSLTDDTRVVVLAATRGKRADWNDRLRSSRLAVPLLSREFLEPLPLVGRILGETIDDLPWLARQETLVLTETTGKLANLILVEDARTTLTSNGTPAIADQAFVNDNDVRSVIAMGGRYLNGASLVMTLFTSESLTREQATKFPTIVSTIKTATMKTVMATNIL